MVVDYLLHLFRWSRGDIELRNDTRVVGFQGTRHLRWLLNRLLSHQVNGVSMSVRGRISLLM